LRGKIGIREGKRIEEWDGNRSGGIAQHSSQDSNLKSQTSNLKPQISNLKSQISNLNKEGKNSWI
jgi:hypothetical protein